MTLEGLSWVGWIQNHLKHLKWLPRVLGFYTMQPVVATFAFQPQFVNDMTFRYNCFILFTDWAALINPNMTWSNQNMDLVIVIKIVHALLLSFLFYIFYISIFWKGSFNNKSKKATQTEWGIYHFQRLKFSVKNQLMH